MKKLVLSLFIAGLLASCSESVKELPQNTMAKNAVYVVKSDESCQKQQACELPRLPKLHPKVSNINNTCAKRISINAKANDTRKISEAEWLKMHFNEMEIGHYNTCEYEVAGTEFIATEVNGERCFVEKTSHNEVSHHVKPKKHLTEGVPVVLN